MTAPITLAGLRQAVTDFAAGSGPDRGWAALLAATAPAVDPAIAAHRGALHRWLNAWGCRLRYPRPGEPDLFDVGVAAWWREWRHTLPTPGMALAGLGDDTIVALGDCYAALAAVPVSQQPRRSLGSTAATKMLYALRPLALMPWDEAIARRLHGRRDAVAYAAHQRLGRDWARALLAEAGTTEQALSEELGRPGRTLAKMLDDYCYLVFTRGQAAEARGS